MKTLRHQYLPTCATMGFLRVPASVAAAGFVDWQNEILRSYSSRVEQKDVRGVLSAVVGALLPLTAPIAGRSLFVGTSSEWCAYLNNSVLGTDASGVMRVLAKRLDCRCLRATSRKGIPGKNYTANILEVFDGSNVTRDVYAMNDGGRWDFGAHGAELDGEDSSRYTLPRIADRFRSEDLDRVLSRMGIRWNELNFYERDGECSAILCTRMGNVPAPTRVIEKWEEE